jgi:hypothetical protein
MPVPTNLSDLSTTAGSNFPAGSNSPADLDDTQRAHASFIAQLRDGSHVPSATAKTTPVDADLIPINDSAASNIIKKVTWANFKATLKTYFDTLYAATGAFAASGANSDITSLSALTNGIVGTSGDQTISGTKTFSTQPALPQKLTIGTSLATTGGTYVDITGIPSWAKQITVLPNGVSTNGTSVHMLQMGSGSFESTGYVGFYQIQGTATVAGAAGSGSGIQYNPVSAANSLSGRIVMNLAGSNTWHITGQVYVNSSNMQGLVYTKTLSGTLDRIRLTTANGTDTFDAGSINIIYE